MRKVDDDSEESSPIPMESPEQNSDDNGKRELWRELVSALQFAKQITVEEIANPGNVDQEVRSYELRAGDSPHPGCFVWWALNEEIKRAGEIAARLELTRPFAFVSEISATGKHYEWCSLYAPDGCWLDGFNLVMRVEKSWYKLCSLVDEHLETWLSFAEAEVKRSALPPPAGKPRWDRPARKLFVGKTVVRELSHIAHNGKPHNIAIVLDAFEEAEWPPAIDDPLPDGPNSERLHETIRSLNEKAAGIRFHGNGTACGIRWELVAR